MVGWARTPRVRLRNSLARGRHRGKADFQIPHDFVDAFGDRFAVGMTLNLRTERRFIGIVDASKSRELSGPGLPVKAFTIALFANVYRRVDVDLDKISSAATYFIAHSTIRRNGRYQHDDAIPAQQVCYKADAADILVAVLFAETEIFPQVLAKHISV